MASADRIIDSDGHIVEEEAAIAEHLPSPYRESGWHLRRAIFPPLDHLHTEPVRYLPGAFQQAGPDEWLDFLQDIGIERTVLYPTAGLAYGNINNRPWATAVARAYNDWLHERYLERSPRFQGMALIPLQDPQAAVEELRRAVEKLGMVGAMLPSNGLSQPLGSKQYWPVYAEAERLGCSLAVHGGSHFRFGIDQMDVYPGVPSIGHPLGLIISITSMVLNGIFDKFPNLRVAYLEGGVAWLALILERLDRVYDTHIPYDPRREFVQLESGEHVGDYIIERMKTGKMFIGCEGDEPMISSMIKLVGSEPFLFSSDFPHEVNTEMCRHEIEELLENPDLTAADKDAILYRNAQRFYAFTSVAA